ncbi:sigma-70 family RNA polymerase sigma factor [Pseudomonas sp. LRF_L74]|uniref:sigma-70 family RNA polymerase sigma factor n=1 Tax=Pseudomonas sp. LRF_L74 TaxID=3369422 RepID=UPI003F5D56C3
MTKSSPDTELIGALALHYDDLVDYIRRRFQGSQFAREVIHDVCVQLLEKPPQQPIKLPFAFLRKASFNRAIDRRRADCTRDARFEGVAEIPDWHVHELDGAVALDFEQQLDALLAIIDALPARARQVFLLHRIHDMPQREIAEELGVSVNMVTQHFARAMRIIARDWEPARLALAGRP